MTAWHTTNQIRVSLAGHVLGLDHGFHRTHTPGELIQRVDGDVTSVSDFLGTVVPRAVGALTMVSGMVLVLAVVDWRLEIDDNMADLGAGLVSRPLKPSVAPAPDGRTPDREDSACLSTGIVRSA